MKTAYTQKRDGLKALAFTICTVLFMLLSQCNPAHAQQDSVHYVMIPDQQAISFITANLRLSHRTFQQGTVTFAAAGVLAYCTDKFAPEEMKAPLYYSSAAIGLAGLVLLVHSHSYIGRAGRVRLSPAGLVLMLTPKQARNVR